MYGAIPFRATDWASSIVVRGDWVVLCTLRVGSAAESGHGLRPQFA